MPDPSSVKVSSPDSCGTKLPRQRTDQSLFSGSPATCGSPDASTPGSTRRRKGPLKSRAPGWRSILLTRPGCLRACVARRPNRGSAAQRRRAGRVTDGDRRAGTRLDRPERRHEMPRLDERGTLLDDVGLLAGLNADHRDRAHLRAQRQDAIRVLQEHRSARDDLRRECASLGRRDVATEPISQDGRTHRPETRQRAAASRDRRAGRA